MQIMILRVQDTSEDCQACTSKKFKAKQIKTIACGCLMFGILLLVNKQSVGSSDDVPLDAALGHKIEVSLNCGRFLHVLLGI